MRHAFSSLENSNFQVIHTLFSVRVIRGARKKYREKTCAQALLQEAVQIYELSIPDTKNCPGPETVSEPNMGKIRYEAKELPRDTIHVQCQRCIMLLQPNPHRESFTDGFAAERSNEYAVKWRWPEHETPWELAANRSSSNRTHQSYWLGDIFTRTMILDTLISHMNSRRRQEVTLKFKKATTYAPEQKSDRKENDHDHGNCTTVRLIFLPAEKARSYRVRAESCRRKKGLRATIRIRHANTDNESRNISNDLSAIIYLYICPVRYRIQRNQQSNLEKLVLDWINENRKMLIVHNSTSSVCSCISDTELHSLFAFFCDEIADKWK